MANTNHADITGANVHTPLTWTYADQAAREAASGFVAGDVGKFARQSDDNSVWMLTDDSPVAWTQVSTSGGTTISRLTGTVLLDTVVAAGGQASFDLNNIPAGYEYIEIHLQGRLESVNPDDGQVLMTFNNDTTDTNYLRGLIYLSNATVGGQTLATRSIGYFGTSADADSWGQMRAIIFNYDSTSVRKTYEAHGGQRYNSTVMFQSHTMGEWENTAPITRITLTPAAGEFAQNTRCLITGWGAENILS